MYYRFSNRANFYIRLFALIMLFCFLLIDLVSVIIYPSIRTKDLGYSERVTDYYSFFTTQSNYLVAAYFTVYLYNSYFKQSTVTFPIRLAVTVYITITMIIFWSGIFTFSAEQRPDTYTLYDWIKTVILHFVMPVIMISSFIITSGQETILVKKWTKNYLWIIPLYPLLYSVIILIRGQLRYMTYHGYTNFEEVYRKTLYPYFFFDISRPHGIFFACLAIIVIFSLVFILQFFYIWINKKMFYFKESYKQKLTNKKMNNYYKNLKKIEKEILSSKNN